MDPILDNPRSLSRAASAMRCLPFRLGLYRLLEQEAISSAALWARADVETLCRTRLTADDTETLFIWLIRLGVLRREVDGQGLTERVRLTPMGRQLLAGWGEEIPRAGWKEQLRHAISRYRPRL
jgi:hypothetical protein